MDYSKLHIKSYDYWNLSLHANQYPYVGRCLAFVKRENADMVLDLLKEERDEFFDKILPEWDSVVKNLYNYDRPNIAIFGNTDNHLHAHLIPRYNTPRERYGYIFIDENPRGNYAPYKDLPLSEELLLRIKNDIKNQLSLSEGSIDQ